MDQLTTPVMMSDDAVFPGENWFLYWKTSPSLWEEKLQEYQGPSPLFVPIYWALHTEYPENFDFGDQKPGTNLKRLEDTAKKCGIEIIFLFPLTPIPFLSNGGIPSYVSRTISKDKDNLAVAIFDSEKNLHKIFSFFDPKVFQAYRKFCYQFGLYLSQAGLSSRVMGIESMKYEDGFFVSLLKDHSSAFESGFNKYIKQLQDSEPSKVELMLENPSLIKNMKQEYYDLVSNLYCNTCEELLGGSWSGILKTHFVGSGSADLFRRSQNLWDADHFYFKPLLESISQNIYPSSLLLPKEIKSQSLGKIFSDLVDTTMIMKFTQANMFSEDLSLNYQQLALFQIYNNGKSLSELTQLLEESGIRYYFEQGYPWLYNYQSINEISLEDLNEKAVHFFFGSKLSPDQLSKVLKVFLHGSKVFLDISNLTTELKKRLEIFFTENNLKEEKINYISHVSKVRLGEGVIILYQSQMLKDASLIKRSGFWDAMIKYFDLNQVSIKADDELIYFWRSRASNSYELDYEEIRRVSFYNPTSYKKTVHLGTSKHFAFLKVVDDTKVEVKSTPLGIDIRFLPGGYVTLDFGYFE